MDKLLNHEHSLIFSTEYETTHSVMSVGRNYAIAAYTLQKELALRVCKDEPEPIWPKTLRGLTATTDTILKSIPKINLRNIYDVLLCFGVVPSAGVKSKRHVKYFVTEYGANIPIDGLNQHIESDGMIAVPSKWVLSILVESGVKEDGIFLLPSGVDPDLLTINYSEERRNSLLSKFNIPRESFVFGNVGALTANKGIDILIEAFDKAHPLKNNLTLIIKDTSELYGLTLDGVIQQMLNDGRLRLETIKRIFRVTGPLTLTALRDLYWIMDCYVSPYRAEGFNLPVLEAICCNIPVIVTSGGPTDEFTMGSSTRRIESASQTEYMGVQGRWLLPSVDSLIDLMQQEIARRRKNLLEFERTSEALKRRYSYVNLTKDLIYNLRR